MLRLDGQRLYDDRGWLFEPQTRCWLPAEPADGSPLSLAEAVSWLQQESGSPWRPPVGLIGPRNPSPRQLVTAETIGAGIAGLGLTLLCGGHQGVMEAACRGAHARGGITIGILPGTRREDANPFVTYPIPTGLGHGRNMLVARAAQAVIAIGGSFGTLSEIAFAKIEGITVVGLQTWGLQRPRRPDDPIRRATDAKEAVAMALEAARAAPR